MDQDNNNQWGTSHAIRPFLVDFIANRLSSARLFIDANAGSGFYSLLGASRHARLEIIALEPDSASFSLLAENIQANDLSNIQAIQKSLWNEAHEGVESITLGTLLKEREPQPTVIRINADGHELRALEGLRESLPRFGDLALLMQLNPEKVRRAGHTLEEVTDTLRELNFVLYVLDENSSVFAKDSGATDWGHFLGRDGSLSLYCVQQTRALSICFFSHSASLAGAERSLLELATELVQDHGVVVTVVLPEPGPLADQLTSVGASCLHQRYGWWCAVNAIDVAKMRADLGAPCSEMLYDLVPKLQRINPDVIVTNTVVIPWGAIVARLLNKPHIWSICEHLEWSFPFQFVLPHDQILGLIDKSSSYLFTGSDALRLALFPNLSEERCQTLPRFIRIPEPSGTPPESHEYFPSPGAVHIGMFATLCEVKGQLDAVCALGELVRRGHNVDLLLAGHRDEDYCRKVERAILDNGLQDRVRIPGFVPDVYNVMRQTDVVVICSHYEAAGRVAIEGMLLGKPIVYPAVGGFLEYLQDGNTGLAYPPGDALAMADRIEDLLTDPNLKRQLEERAAVFVRQRFTPEQFGGRFVKVVQRLRDTRRHQTGHTEQLLAEAMLWISAHLRAVGDAPRTLASRLQALQRMTEEHEINSDARTHSLGWRMLSGYWRLVEGRFPRGTRRRRALDALFSVGKRSRSSN